MEKNKLEKRIILGIVFIILFSLSIVLIVKNISYNTSKINIDKILLEIKENNKDLELVEENKIDNITNLVYKDNNIYKSIIIDIKTGEEIDFNDLIKDDKRDEFLLKEEELLNLKYPLFISKSIKENKNNKGYKVYYMKDNLVTVYYYNYIFPNNYKNNISLIINYNEIKDMLEFKPKLDKDYQNESGYNWDKNKKSIAITFDDGPSSKYNSLILKSLDENKAHATFFMVGYMMDNCQVCVKDTYLSGNEIGSHTYNHINISNNSKDNVNNDINKINDLYYSITNDYIKIIRPPYGSYNQNNLDNINMPFILWDLDTEDWRYRNKEHIVNYIKENIKDGSIILMHELYDASYQALEEILPWLYQNDYQVMSVSELANIKGISLSKGKAYRDFK